MSNSRFQRLEGTSPIKTTAFYTIRKGSYHGEGKDYSEMFILSPLAGKYPGHKLDSRVIMIRQDDLSLIASGIEVNKTYRIDIETVAGLYDNPNPEKGIQEVVNHTILVAYEYNPFTMTAAIAESHENAMGKTRSLGLNFEYFKAKSEEYLKSLDNDFEDEEDENDEEGFENPTSEIKNTSKKTRKRKVKQ